MPREYSDEDRQFLLSWVGAWSRSVDLQAQRVAAATVDYDQGIESDLFLHAVRNLRRACVVFIDDHRVRAAIEAFDAAAGDIKGARDLLEHFDEYDRGVGRLQRDQKMREDRLLLYYTDTGSEKLIRIGPHEINITRTAAAAVRLGDSVLEVAYGP